MIASPRTKLCPLKPKYISGLLTSAATRRLDHLRAEEKMIQREREAEGDEFRDKETFVTQAYKDQMAEVRRAEEEERKREGVYNMATAPNIN
jgi:coiled-coil domain-containing protein 55